MTLQDLSQQLVQSFPSYAQKDLKTAVRVLAKALQCADPQHCTFEQYNQPLPSLYRLVETYLLAQGKGPHTIRNVKNNLSRFFRLAEQSRVFSSPPPILISRYSHETKPARPGSAISRKNGTHLLYRQWPLDLQNAFTAFHTWATSPLVPGRNATLKKRHITVELYRQGFEGYFGYLHHVQHVSPLIFESLFDLSLVTAYVHWHINELHKHPTRTIHRFLAYLCTLTRQYRPLPELRVQLTTLKKTIPIPPPVYNKEDAWVSRDVLQDVGRSLWPRKQPTDLACRHTVVPGSRLAHHAGISLMLQLWCYIPYRQRNIREMQLDDNLHQDAQGCWHITFRGEQLKVARKRGQINVFDLEFPPALVPVLEQYLQVWRPILLVRQSHRYNNIFLTMLGTPYTGKILCQRLTRILYRYTGKHWHPHMIRTVWATEFIRGGGDPYKAAIMLNDTLETVIKNYAHLRNENVAKEVYEMFDQRNGHGK